MLIKRKSADVQRGRLQSALGGLASGVMDRRSFLRRSGLVAGGVAAASALQIGAVRKAEAAGYGPATGSKVVKNICTHCSVGCTVKAEVANGVWVGQEPAWKARSTAAAIAPRAPRCASWSMATAASNTR